MFVLQEYFVKEIEDRESCVSGRPAYLGDEPEHCFLLIWLCGGGARRSVRVSRQSKHEEPSANHAACYQLQLLALFAPCDSSSSLPTSLSASALRRYRRACHPLQPRHRQPRSLSQAKMDQAAHTSKECSVSQRSKNSP